MRTWYCRLGTSRAGLLAVFTVGKLLFDWLGQDGGWESKASWNSGFGSPAFCSGMSLPVLNRDCMKNCS
jgi:hypothetical protein